MEKLSSLPWVFFWVAVTVWVVRNLIYSKFGRGIISIREDEIASDLMSVNTKQVKILAFVISSFLQALQAASLRISFNSSTPVLRYHKID